MLKEQWSNFVEGNWTENIDVRDFIQKNYELYEGNEEFLTGTTERTKILFKKASELMKKEIEKGVLDIDTEHISGIDNFDAGYLDKENEIVFGFQTDLPLKRMLNPFGGIRMVESSLEAYGYSMSKELNDIFHKYRKTHNEGVFDVYTPEMKTARSVGLLTGLPDAYGRGRIIGDYRRIALYGLDFLITKKQEEYNDIVFPMIEENIRAREEIKEQIKALKSMKSMALKYNIDLSKPSNNTLEAVQAIYFGYLAGVKENNGAAMSLGRVSTFIDIYAERDISNNKVTESEIQEIIDQFVLKLRMVRHLRTPEYNELFAGDPNWVTESIGGMGSDKRTLVTKTSFRFLHTLSNLSSAPEPNMTVLWSNDLPVNFKKYCAKISIETSAIQYENDDIMRPIHGDDYGIACCVSAMRIGKDMQFFGARCNLAKSLLMAINGGVDEITKIKVISGIKKINTEVIKYEDVLNNYKDVLCYVAKLYVNTMNIIHYMHDKYAYEAGLMALHDYNVGRYMAFGVAGISIVADSLSAIKYAKVKPIYDVNGIAVDFEIIGDFPMYGNDDDKVDMIAEEILEIFSSELKKHQTYRNAHHTLSVLTITSNVVYGKKTGSTPDGRGAGEPFAPGANPMNGRDRSGILASLNSVAKLKYENICEDGISNTFTVIPQTLGKLDRHRVDNLVNILDGYFVQKAHHINVNVMDKSTLQDAMENPEKYPNLTVRVSGYAVNFNRLTREQQMDVISRTFHEKM
ncbi:formate C-acetyltransferase [Sedimentibacter acidaminivorans]|uniref:Formate acetyltransferase n=1 Tax=Sedimentibacter acidaminivorans TaxID=913099 RepID=A0ABS4GH29_9FIRM|nr:formate C-acetyltransferase [Sedimentibacter acidaminivorans]MBP1926990.1 formate C-acetyltransferase [Sedimentibacter acidaminivorans]